jgi:hypothetical protein
METPIDAAFNEALLENVQKYRYILENIDWVFIDFSCFVPNFALHINKSIEKSFGYLFVSKTCIFH